MAQRSLLLLLALSWILPAAVSAGGISNRVNRHVRDKQFKYNFHKGVNEALGSAVKAGVVSKNSVRKVHVLRGTMKVNLGARAIIKRKLKKDAAAHGVALMIVPKKISKWKTTYNIEISGTNAKKVDKYANHLLKMAANKQTTVPYHQQGSLQSFAAGLQGKAAPKKNRRQNKKQKNKKQKPALRGSRRTTWREASIGVSTDGNLSKRSENQDAIGSAVNPQSGLLLAVCDGAGGHEGGREAAWTGMKAVEKAFRKSKAASPEGQLLEAIEHANNTVLQAKNAGEKMGVSTFTGALITKDNKLLTANLGDSRVYRYRKQKNNDHTGLTKLTKDQGEGHRIFEYLGKKQIRPVVKNHGKVRKGDRILVCSDGLYRFVERKEIARLMASDLSGQQISKALVKLAKKNGSDDNITVQVYAQN